MNVRPRCSPSSRWLAAAFAVVGTAAQAGTFIDFGQPSASIVTHPNGYTGQGGEFAVGVCLDPAAPPQSGNPEQALRNVVATYNRNEATIGNVVTNNAGKVDFESVLLHEVGHCIGMDHNVLGPSEVGSGGNFSDPRLYFANAKPGTNDSFDTDDGADNVRATRDDARGDDINRNWFRKNVNNPWEIPPAIVDRGTHSVLVSDLPDGFNFVEVASSFDPCNGGQPDSSTLQGILPTQNTMFPVLCTNRFLRDLAPDDVTTLRIARAGRDGSQAATGDNYTPRLEAVPMGPDCDIVVKFVSNAGFAFCQIGGTFLSPDIVITTAEARFQNTVDWHFNPQDTTGGTNPPANLSITMSTNVANAMPGEQVIYTLDIGNAGPATALGTAVSVPTPTGLVFVSNSGGCDGAFPCALGDFAGGATQQIVSTWQVAQDQTGGGVITTTAMVESTIEDNALGNNTAMQTLTVWAPQADLGIDLNDGGASVAPGGSATYTATATNAGPSAANALELLFTLPPGTNLASADGSGWACTDQGDGTVRCLLATLAADASSTVRFGIDVPADYAGPPMLMASASLTSETLDPIADGNNSNSGDDSTPVVVPDVNRIYCHGFEDTSCAP